MHTYLSARKGQNVNFVENWVILDTDQTKQGKAYITLKMDPKETKFSHSALSEAKPCVMKKIHDQNAMKK